MGIPVWMEIFMFAMVAAVFSVFMLMAISGLLYEYYKRRYRQRDYDDWKRRR
jgi:hypothetical protein